MKKLKLTKVIVGSLIAVSVLALTPIGASAGWKQDPKGWWNTEGSSYSKGWKQIAGNWYYFDKYEGYMEHDKIIDGYYLNSNGAWSYGTKEIQEYTKILTNNNLLKNKYNLIISDESLDKNYLLDANIIDLNQDGISEMIVTNGTCEADKSVAIFTYTDGNVILVDNLHNTHAEYNGYNKDEKVFIICGAQMGDVYGYGYKLENDKCNKVYSWKNHIDYKDGERIEDYYILNGEKISSEEFQAFIDKFTR